jgi:hypothetical protein
MVDLNAPGTGPAQAGTSVTSEATAQQSSGSSSEAGQENGQALAESNNQPSAGRGVASKTTSDDGIPARFSTSTISALKELSNTNLPSHGDGPQNSRIGAHMLVSWNDRGSWILDRTDRFAISAEAWRPRSFAIDLAVPELPAVDGEQCFLPLEAFPLYYVREVTASDENGIHLSILSSVDQRNAIGSMLVAFASIIVNADRTMLPDGSQTSEVLRSATFSRDLDQIDTIQNEVHRKALQDSAEFMNLARFFVAREFLCLRTSWSKADKRPHVVRVTYQEAVESRPKLSGSWLRQAGAKLGIGATRLNVPLPPARTASHWRFVITAPMGAELYGCRLIGDQKNIRQPATVTEGKQTVVPFGPEDGFTSMDIEFRISKQWRTWVLTNALLITLLLAVGAWRISFVAQTKADLGTKDLTAAFLLGINGAFAGILARPTDDALTSTYLSGIRIAISILGILAFAAVATLAFGPSGDALFLVWFAFALAAGFVFVLVLVGSGFWQRR